MEQQLPSNTVQPSSTPVPSSQPTIPPQEPVLTPPMPPSQDSSHKNPLYGTKWLLLAGILFFILIASVIFLARNQSTTQGEQLSGDIKKLYADTTVLATVGDKEIRYADIIQLAKEQYLPSAIDKSTLKILLDTLIEREILDQAANKRNIILTDQQIRDYTNDKLGGETQNLTSEQLKQEKYSLVKEKIVMSLVTSSEAYAIGFWLPNENYGGTVTEERRKIFEQQRIEGVKALDEAEVLLKRGQEPYDVARIIYKKYPILQSRLALNGAYINMEGQNEIFRKPHIYTGEHRDNDPIAKTIFSMKPYEIKQVRDYQVGSYAVIKVISQSTGDFKTYEDWLTSQKQELVKVKNQL